MRYAKKITLNDEDQTTVCVSGLASDKRYYVRVREVQKDSCGNTICGSWSKTVNVLK